MTFLKKISRKHEMLGVRINTKHYFVMNNYEYYFELLLLFSKLNT